MDIGRMINELKWIWQEVVVNLISYTTLPGICLEKRSEENHRTSVKVATVLCLEFISTQRCRIDDSCTVKPLFKVSLRSSRFEQ
jgi:hypothetical protein